MKYISAFSGIEAASLAFRPLGWKPLAFSAGFCNAAVKAGSIGYEPEQHMTLRAGSNLASVGAVLDKRNVYAIYSDGHAFKNQNGKGWSSEGLSYTFDTVDRHSIAITPTDESVYCMASDSARAEIGVDMAPTLTAHNSKGAMNVSDRGVVRKLTPLECERLQGMPDDWTRVPYRGRPAEECPDGPRYKAIGNSMAVPVMRWIGERMQIVDEKGEANA